MTSTIRIDDEVLRELKQRAKDLDRVFEPPNTTLRIVLGIDPQPSHQPQAARATLPDEKTVKKPAVLVIHAPYHNTGGKPGEPHSLETYQETGVGIGYAIGQNEKNLLAAGSRVVILRNDRDRKRVEGILVELVRLEGKNSKTSQGIQRYNVVFKDQKPVDWIYNKPQEKLTLRGVKVIDDR